MSRDDRATTAPPGNGRLFFGVLAGPIAWAMQFGVTYSVTPVLCEGGAISLVPYVVAAAGFALATAGLVVAIGSWRRAGGGDTTDVPGVIGRDRVMAAAGIGASAFFMLVVLVQLVPVIYFDPCR